MTDCMGTCGLITLDVHTSQCKPKHKISVASADESCKSHAWQSVLQSDTDLYGSVCSSIGYYPSHVTFLSRRIPGRSAAHRVSLSRKKINEVNTTDKQTDPSQGARADPGRVRLRHVHVQHDRQVAAPADSVRTVETGKR